MDNVKSNEKNSDREGFFVPIEVDNMIYEETHKIASELAEAFLSYKKARFIHEDDIKEKGSEVNE